MGPLHPRRQETRDERLLTYGLEAILVLYLDGALLIDLWNEMEVPEPMRTHWAASSRPPPRTDRR